MEKYISGVKLTVGEKLFQLRKDNHLTMAQVAEKAHISATTISNYESGKYYPTYDALYRLLNVYEVSFHEFCGLDLVDYERDLAVFKLYGLSEPFFRELMIRSKYAQHNDAADCINLIFEYPIFALTLFEELARFFNPAYHEQVDRFFVKLPPDGSKRVLLEPVIHTLSNIFDAKYPQTIIARFQNEAKQQQAIRAQAIESIREYDRIMKKLKDAEKKADG